ncbi:MAG: UDP-N-acetylmuramoyl-tripeptide--D-alanyl-D-alanine ligase [Patescibacteria group bacterium UBA2103]
MKTFLKSLIVPVITLQAKMVLKKYKPTIVVVTGSVGKTSMKDAVAEVLSRQFFVRKSQKSFNSETGVPLTILGCENPWNNHFLWLKVMFEGLLLIFTKNHYPKMLVLEVGADKPGDVSGMMEWITPSVVVVTKLPSIPVHVEAYASPDQTREEEFSPAHALGSEGTLIYSKDDEFADELARGVNANIMTYGFSDKSDVRGEYQGLVYEGNTPKGLTADILRDDKKECVVVNGAAGKHQLYPALGAFAVGLTFDMTPSEICAGLASYVPPQGRMRIHEGIKNTLLIDDSYNASPVAMIAALETFADIDVSGDKIVVLGDMLELGTFSMDEHIHVGRYVAKKADFLITVGLRAKGIAEGANKGRMAKKNMEHFNTSEEAAAFLVDKVGDGDAVLVKGSQGVRMERISEALLLNKEKAKDLLVRQDVEWKRR